MILTAENLVYGNGMEPVWTPYGVGADYKPGRKVNPLRKNPLAVYCVFLEQ